MRIVYKREAHTNFKTILVESLSVGLHVESLSVSSVREVVAGSVIKEDLLIAIDTINLPLSRHTFTPLPTSSKLVGVAPLSSALIESVIDVSRKTRVVPEGLDIIIESHIHVLSRATSIGKVTGNSTVLSTLAAS